MTGRFTGLGVFFAALWIVLIGRVAFIQVVQASHYRDIAKGQSVARDVLSPARGEVFDREGVRLAVNRPDLPDDRRTGTGRIAPNGHLAGQVIGMVGRDGYGQSGLEFQFDRELRGTDGWRYARLDVKRRYAPGTEDRMRPAVDGLGVRLTLDARVQSVAELALERGVKRTGAQSGVAIVLDPRTGDLLALANYPFFDPNARRAHGAGNWRNNTVALTYEPGSTFKVFTAAALMEEGRIRGSDTIDAEGGRWRIGGEWIRDTHPRDRISFADAVAHSSNIVFAKVSTRVSPVSFYKYLRSFGFGLKTGVSLPAEEGGLLKPVADWSGRTQQTIAFGHEVSVTPLQLAMAFGAIANDGLLMKPRLVRSWVDASGRAVRDEPVREVRRVLSPTTAEALREMMKGVVEYGTAKDIRHPFITIAGKTGSSQKIDPQTGRYVEGSYYSSFAGMAPAEEPAFVCIVVVDDPRQHKFGGQAAGPIFREILDRLAERGIGGDWAVPPPPAEVMAAAPGADGAAGSGGASPERKGFVRTALAAFRLPGSAPSAASTAEPADGSSSGRSASASAPVRTGPGEMPDLRESTLRDALARLRTLGVDVEYTGEGRVIEQEPAPGTPLRKGARARLTLGWAG